jgi:ATP-binding cassette subfamily B protein
MAWKNFRTAGDRLASGVQNRLSANLTVKTYSAEERENIVFSEETNTASIYAHNGWKASSDNSFNAQLLQKFGHAAIFFIGCGMILNNSTTYGDVTAFVAYANMLFWPIIRFTMFAERLQNVRIAADRLFEILEEEPQVKEAENPITLKNVSGKVDFNNIHFEYEEGHPIICGFDLHVKPGETIALVGPTGCGKTTILSLLMRFWDVKEGSITIDGVDIREISKYSLKSLFGIVLQESLLFTTSIADNIRYARPSATMDEVINAAKIAEIHNEIMTLPRGYESVIGDKDVQLSVGQKQRISIARAVLANPTILIMDEATSSLDSRSESAIKQALDRFLANKTSFIVAHRLSTIKNADKIILLDKGTIIEQGNHEELMQIENGRYRELYEKHSGAGIILDDSEAEE